MSFRRRLFSGILFVCLFWLIFVAPPWAGAFELCKREMSDFHLTEDRVGIMGLPLYTSKKDPDKKFIIKKKNDWLEAYAGSLFRFLIGEHAQEVCVIRTDHEVFAAIAIEPTFKSADRYSGDKSYQYPTEKQILPPGRGLGGIIVSSMLLGDVDLKGLSSNDSNLGIVIKEGVPAYYKIDAEQALSFGYHNFKKAFDLTALSHPSQDMEFLKRIRLNDQVSPAHLEEIKEEAIRVAQIPKEKLEEVLDELEKLITTGPKYPSSILSELTNKEGVFEGQSVPKTYKEAVLRRHKHLQEVMLARSPKEPARNAFCSSKEHGLTGAVGNASSLLESCDEIASDFKPCVKKMTDLELTPERVGEYGQKAKGSDIYKDREDPHKKYHLLRDSAWIEIYAGTLFRFLAGDYSQEICIIQDGSHLVAAVEVEPTFKSADAYSGERSYSYPTEKKILPPGSGLGDIIVSSVLLGDVNLKGLMSNDSHLGIVTRNGKPTYFKNDAKQSLAFDTHNWNAEFDLTALLHPTKDMAYLQRTRLSGEVSQGHLDEIRSAAQRISRIPRAKVVKVLDQLEKVIGALPQYPNTILSKLGNEEGVFKGQPAPRTYQEAVLRRFDALVRIAREAK